MPATPTLLASIERNSRRLWLLCYRMVGDRAEADDLCQESIARALERADQQRDGDPTGWLLQVATRCCLDHLRRRGVRRRATQLVDHLLEADAPTLTHQPEQRAILRDDLRFAVVVALQRLSPRQRAVLVLLEVCERPLGEVAETIGSNPNATKALLHRARVALAQARGGVEGEVPADPAQVLAFAEALERGSIDALAQLMAENVWGVVDGGGVVRVASRPTRGRSVVARRFANVQRRIGLGVVTEVQTLNGEAALIVWLAADPTRVVAVIHLVTLEGAIAAVLVDRDPRRLTAFGVPLFG